MLRPSRTIPFVLILSLILPACAAATGETEEAKATKEEQAGAVAAYLGSETITVEKVDKAIAGALLELRRKEYDLRRRAVEQIAAQELLQREADARGVTLQELYAAEVEVKAPAPTEEQIAEFYEQNKTRAAKIRGKSLEDARPIVAEMLKQQSIATRQQEYLRGLIDHAGLRIVLDPPRADVPVPAGEPSRGPADAPVTIVEFSDFQCGFCKRVHPTVEQLLAEYGDKIHFVYRDYALPFHERAAPAAIAARCAGDQDRYWDYYADLMENPSELSDDDLRARAAKLKLDEAAFAECYASDRHRAAVDAGLNDGKALGVTGTPTFFVNGRAMVGAVPLKELKAAVDEELQRSPSPK